MPALTPINKDHAGRPVLSAVETYTHPHNGRVLLLAYAREEARRHLVAVYDATGEGEALHQEYLDCVEQARSEFAARRAELKRRGFARAARSVARG